MKNTKRVLAFLVGAAMMLPMASAEGKLASGNYEATSQGFGGAVTVKVTVTDGKVTAATITGDKETETIGGAAIKTLTEKLIGVSSADEVDAVASATVTSNAVKTALADCLRQAAGEEKTETALVDGVYTGEGRGFNLTQKVQVTVEIKDGKIVSVTVGDNGETMGMIAEVDSTRGGESEPCGRRHLRRDSELQWRPRGGRQCAGERGHGCVWNVQGDSESQRGRRI